MTYNEILRIEKTILLRSDVAMRASRIPGVESCIRHMLLVQTGNLSAKVTCICKAIRDGF